MLRQCLIWRPRKTMVSVSSDFLESITDTDSFYRLSNERSAQCDSESSIEICLWNFGICIIIKSCDLHPPSFLILYPKPMSPIIFLLLPLALRQKRFRWRHRPIPQPHFRLNGSRWYRCRRLFFSFNKSCPMCLRPQSVLETYLISSTEWN